MRFDTRNMTPQQIADAERQLNERMMGLSNQPFTGLPKSSMQPQVQLPMGGFPGMGQQQMPPMQPQVQQPARQLSPVRQYLNAMQQYRQGGRQGVRPTYAQFKQPQPGQQLNGMGQVVQPQNFGIAGGGTGMPPMPTKSLLEQLGYTPGQQLGGMPPMGGQPQQPQQPQQGGFMDGMFTYTAGPPGSSGGLRYNPQGMQQPQQPQRQPMAQPYTPNANQIKPQISGGPVGQPMGVASGVGTPPQPDQPPMPMKKGGFAAKPVWDKERPEDLNKPKSLSVKKKKAAKARAKAAGRVYPNLVDNMAAARKKGK